MARRSPPGTNIVCMLPDTGERYQSTVLFEHVGEHMNAEELALSNSTPGCRFQTRTDAGSRRSKPAAPAQRRGRSTQMRSASSTTPWRPNRS